MNLLHYLKYFLFHGVGLIARRTDMVDAKDLLELMAKALVDKPEDVRVEEHEDGLYLLRSRVTWARGSRNGSEEVVRYVFVKEKAKL